MKKTYLTIATVLSGLALFSFIERPQGSYENFNAERFHRLSSGGASAGNAGAPGENNCTQCHSGTVQAGSGFNILEWGDGITEYTPGETYSMQLSMEDASAKNGFQILPLKASDNTAAGTIVVTDAARTQVIPGAGGKQYLGHRLAGNSSSTWSFDWTAPSTDVGNVIFYIATNKTNANGQASGDLIRLSQHVFEGNAGSASLTAYQQIQNSLKIGMNPSTGSLDVFFEMQEQEPLYINLVNLQGQSVLSNSLGSSYPGENQKSVKLPEGLTAGLYIVNFFIGNKAYSEKIILE